MKPLLLLSGLILAMTVHAADLRPLTSATMPALTAQHQGQRHALIFWSLTCAPCREELRALGQQQGVERLPISLINTDRRSERQQVKTLLSDYGLAPLDNWQFAAAIPARLRQAIDPDWYGALPYSVLVTADGQRHPHLGVLPVQKLVSWLRTGQGDAGVTR